MKGLFAIWIAGLIYQVVYVGVLCLWYWVLSVDFHSEPALVGIALMIVLAGKWGREFLEQDA